MKPATARQGYAYLLGQKKVLAMNSGTVVEVREILDPWLGQPISVKASWLVPVAMVYFGGTVP